MIVRGIPTGTRVRALKPIAADMGFMTDQREHARAGDLGTVVLVDAGNQNLATVTFDRTGLSTIVFDEEIEVVT